MLPAKSSILEVERFVQSVHLGWTEAEQNCKQEVEFSLKIAFDQSPAACRSDELRDTICYAEVLEAIASFCEMRRFHLIEHMAFACYEMLAKDLLAKYRFQLKLHKLNPPVDRLLGGVSFSFGDQV